ncbi:hypothetical protein [Nautilia sp.]
MKERLNFRLVELQKHLKQLRKNINYLDVFYGFPLKDKYIETIMSSADIDKLDSIAYRMIKFQDSLGRAIKLFFALQEEDTESLTMLDLINLAEKKGFSINVEFWREIRSLRNALTHEYIQNASEIAQAINMLKEKLTFFEKILNELKNRSNF